MAGKGLKTVVNGWQMTGKRNPQNMVGIGLGVPSPKCGEGVILVFQVGRSSENMERGREVECYDFGNI